MKAEIIFIGNDFVVEDFRQERFGVGVSVRAVWIGRPDTVDRVKHCGVFKSRPGGRILLAKRFSGASYLQGERKRKNIIVISC
ncbi:hypothetical protein E2C01_017121 [Portunus trituberculatus]|uniref:Uncharacterized protein n=1 Tax=Portunus trituberculatus TaxID=210409 RepID=A0A5B7DRG9_PORTR|nr:hypothetical protein [Portunus trituberculatus]